ncbi:IS110 family transposase, partial [Thauera linaloolentis]
AITASRPFLPDSNKTASAKPGAIQFAAWLGLVPGQYSSGGKARLGRITKAGDSYLRSLLVMGARAVLAAAKNKTDTLSRWAMALQQRR